MAHRTLRVLGALLLGSPALAQAPILPFEIDGVVSQFAYAGSTSAGPLVGNPSQFRLSGTLNLGLADGLVHPVGSVEFLAGSSALVTPNINATVPNPVFTLPPLVEINITMLRLSFESAPLSVNASGVFNGPITPVIEEGVMRLRSLGGVPVITDLAGVRADPMIIAGQVIVTTFNTQVSVQVNAPLNITDPGTGLNANVLLAGLLRADYVFPQPMRYCATNPNSTGARAVVGSSGRPRPNAGNFTLHASLLPLNSMGYFLFSDSQDLVPLFGGSQGNLCLGGQIFRLSQYVVSSGASGLVSLPMPYGGLPGGVDFAIGEEWNFQYWFRDQIGGVPTSNVSDGLHVVFMP